MSMNGKLQEWFCFFFYDIGENVVSNFMMVTALTFRLQNPYGGDFFRYVGDCFIIGHQHLRLVINTNHSQHPSPTSI